MYYTQYTTLQSLISNNVYYAYKDSRGYMWFATDKGISRFDGKEFKHYTTLDGIGDNEIFGFYEDRARRLWLFTYNGSNCYLRNDSVFNAGNDPLLKSMSPLSFINTMYDADDTTLYIGYRFGEIIKISGTSIKQVQQRLSAEELTAVFGANGFMYAAGKDSIFTIDGGVHAAQPVNSYTRWRYHNGLLFASDKTGLKLYRNNRLQWEYPDKELTYEYIINISSDDAGNVFASTTNGLHIINQATKRKTVLFRGQRISNVAQDICGNYWVASFGNGVYCINRELEKLEFVRHIENTTVYSISPSQFFVRQNDTLYSFHNGGLAKENLPHRFTANYQPLYADEHLLFFSRSSIMYVYNKKTGTVVATGIGPRWIFPGKSNFIGVGKYGGTVHYLKIEKNLPVVHNTFNSGQNTRHAEFSAFDSTVYLLMDNALCKIVEEKASVKTIERLHEAKNIMEMYCVGNFIVLLTNTNSLIVYNIAKNYERTVLSTGGTNLYNLAHLGGNKFLTYTGNGYYMLSFDNVGLPRINLQKIEYPFRSGQLFNIYPAGNRLLCDVNGSLYSISKDLLNKQSDKPVFSIKKIEVNGREYHNRNIKVANARRGSIDLTLSTLHFNNFDNSYQYRIHSEGETGPWYRTNDDKLHILIPDYGDYKLELRAITANNKVSSPVYLYMALEPPFYSRAWFKSIVALFAAACVLYSIYLYNKRRRKIFQNRLNHMKLEHRAINSLLNPHFTFNAINNIQNLVNDRETDKANDYLAVLSKLIRQNMENLHFSLIPVEKELELVTNYIYLQNLRFDNKIKIIICNQLPQAQDVNIPPLLIHTFVENAVVHGFSTKADDFTITVDLSLSVDDYLIISIRDNGLGLKQQKDHSHLHDKTSMGIDITKTRLERLSRFYKVRYSVNISDINENGQTGTEVAIILYSKFKEPVT